MFGWRKPEREKKTAITGSKSGKAGIERDDSSIESLYRLYFDRIYTMVYNQVGRNHADAEEVVQETWLAAVKSAGKFKGESQPYTWLCSIAWHKIRDFQRRRYRDKSRLYQPSTETDLPELQFIDTNPLPDEIIEKEETREVVRAALFCLPDHYRQVLTLKYLDEMPARDIGQVMSRSTKSVESLLDRARMALRKEITRLSK